MRSLRRFLGLSQAERMLLLEAVGWLGVARLMLIAMPFSRISEGLSRPVDRMASDVDAETIARIAWAVYAAANRVPWRADCFPQAIAAHRLLDRRGMGSTIHIGVVQEPGGELTGHAWLTCGDRVVTGGAGLERYAVLHRLSSEHPQSGMS